MHARFISAPLLLLVRKVAKATVAWRAGRSSLRTFAEDCEGSSLVHSPFSPYAPFAQLHKWPLPPSLLICVLAALTSGSLRLDPSAPTTPYAQILAGVGEVLFGGGGDSAFGAAK